MQDKTCLGRLARNTRKALDTPLAAFSMGAQGHRQSVICYASLRPLNLK
jgi:hypothetical protein